MCSLQEAGPAEGIWVPLNRHRYVFTPQPLSTRSAKKALLAHLSQLSITTAVPLQQRARRTSLPVFHSKASARTVRECDRISLSVGECN